MIIDKSSKRDTRSMMRPQLIKPDNYHYRCEDIEAFEYIKNIFDIAKRIKRNSRCDRKAQEIS